MTSTSAAPARRAAQYWERGRRFTRSAGEPAAVRWILVPLAVMALGWSPMALQPATGIDQSWQASLAMAITHGLSFGDRIVFTYGPLGFLSQPEAWELHLVQLAVLYELVIRFAVAAVLFNAARASFGGLAGFLIAVVVASLGLGMAQDGELVIFLAVAARTLDTEMGERRALAFALLAGVYAAFELLVKVSVGGSLVLMAAVTLAAMAGPWRRCAVAAVGAFLLGILVLWLIAGQPIAALPPYLVNSLSITAGYTSAMSGEAPGLGWEYTVALLGLALGLWAAWQSGGGLARRQRGGLVVLWAAFWFAEFKEGFVRHDAGHGLYFFISLMAGFVVFRWRPGTRALGAIGLGALVAVTLAAQSATLTTDLRPGPSVSAFVRDIGDVTSTARERRIAAAGRAYITHTEPLDAGTVALLRGHTVGVYPIEQALAWAYGFDWDPLPVLQSYAAYTTRLDQVNAAFLASPRAPQRILYEGTPGLDGRVGAFDESATLRTLFCRYRFVPRTASYAVLIRGENLCTVPAAPIAVVHAAWGQPVAVPAPPVPRSLVYVDIAGTGSQGLEQLVSLVYKPTARYVSLNGGPPARFVPGTATDGLPLRMSAGTDWPGIWHVAVNATSIAVMKGLGGGRGGSRSLTYRFYVQLIDLPRSSG